MTDEDAKKEYGYKLPNERSQQKDLYEVTGTENETIAQRATEFAIERAILFDKPPLEYSRTIHKALQLMGEPLKDVRAMRGSLAAYIVGAREARGDKS